MTGAFDWMPGFDGAEQVFEGASAAEQNKALIEKAAQERREAARLFFDVFAFGRGPELLELLRDRTIELDLMNISDTIGNDARQVPLNPAEWAYHRNGQNSVVRWIEQMVREAATVETEGKDNV